MTPQIISARRGEFETGFEKGGQTREHALLAKTVGVRTLIVAINKMDDSTVEWQKERCDSLRFATDRAAMMNVSASSLLS